MRERWSVRLVTVTIGGWALLAPGQASRADVDHPRPTVKLKVSTHNGFIPFTLILTGEVTGVVAPEARLCYVGVERTITGPNGKPLDAVDQFPCFAASSSDTEVHSFKKELTLDESGIYRYRMVIPREKGKRLYSISQEVRAIAEPGSLRNLDDSSRRGSQSQR